MGHKTLGIKEAAAESRKKWHELNPEVLQQSKKMEEAVAKVDAVCDSVQKTGGEVVEEIEDTFRELIELIEERKNQLKVEAMQRTQVRVKALKDQSRYAAWCCFLFAVGVIFVAVFHTWREFALHYFKVDFCSITQIVSRVHMMIPVLGYH